MFKKLNIRGASHHFLMPVLAILLVAGIGGFIMQRNSSAAVKVYTTANGKTCVQRTFAYRSKSTCVAYAQKMMGLKGSDVDGAFGPTTLGKLKTAARGATVLNSSSWKKLCDANRNTTVWRQAGCGGQGTDTYRSKPTGTATNSSYRWGYFNCYPKSKIYPSKPVWGCERKWVKKTDTIKTGTTYAIKSAQANVKKRHTQFQKDYKAWYSTKAYYDGNISDNAFGADCKNDANGTMITSAKRTVKVGVSNKTKGKTNTLVCKAKKAY